jgi:hypothetical protein
MRKIVPALAVLIAAPVPSAAVATAQARTEHFSFVDTSTTAPEPVYSVIATGAFTDGGTAAKEGKDILVLRLSVGTITFRTDNRAAGTDKTVTATTCIQTQAKHGSYRIVGGTGAYKGITGSGRSAIENTFVEALVHGACSNSFAAVQGVVIASGPVALP